MKLTRLAFACLSATAGLAATARPLVAGLTANAAPSHQETSAPIRVAVYDCTSQPQVRPAGFYIFCDGSRTLIKLSWSSWNLSEAAGTGVDYTDTCPSCVQGKWQHHDVVVVLWRPTPVAHHAGQYEYSKMTLLYPATGKTETITLPSY
jgi:hypothetical protein